MISDEFNSFPANPESSLFVVGNLNRLCEVGQLSGRASPKLVGLPGYRSAFAGMLETKAAQPRH
jgi:hypothetical protein